MNWLIPLVQFLYGFSKVYAQSRRERQGLRQHEIEEYGGDDDWEQRIVALSATGASLLKVKPNSAMFGLDIQGGHYAVVLLRQGRTLQLSVCSGITFPCGRAPRDISAGLARVNQGLERCDYELVIVLDDLTAVLDSDVAVQILLSALEHPAPGDRTRSRVVKYKRQGREERVSFRGGIICISNRELHDDELLGAFKSRVHTLNYDPSDAQLGALMLGIAELGWSNAGRPAITAEEARTVAHYLIGEMLRLGCRFDLRLFVNKALPDYQQWKDDEAESDWRDLVTASIEEHLVAVRFSDERPSRAERKQDEHALVRQIQRDHKTRAEQVQAWIERTGKSPRALYRRMEEM